MDDGIEEGDIVDVITYDGDFIARGHFQRGSIMVRVLTFDDEPIDDGYWQQRLRVALDVRRRINFGAETNAYRLVHGEGDCLPGLIIDIYDKTAVMQAHSIGMHVCRREIGKALMAVLSDSIENVYYKSEMTLPFKEEVVNGFLYGETKDDIAIENGLKFHVDWLRGQKTGFFVDQRENRALLEKYSAGRRVLNMFCYTGGFSFYAMRGGAEVVHSVDSSEKAIALTNSNVELNFPNDSRHKAFCEDAFKFLSNIPDGNIPDSQSPYDLIILDPPAFAKHRGALHNALKGYTRLNAKAMEKIAPGGILFTFSCSQVVTKENFRNAIFTAAAQSGRKIRILHQLHQPADHPINIYHPEGEYLKGLVLYIE
jgi:23S rRNA (cytosine1962-C5)-methyltransferase